MILSYDPRKLFNLQFASILNRYKRSKRYEKLSEIYQIFPNLSKLGRKIQKNYQVSPNVIICKRETRLLILRKLLMFHYYKNLPLWFVNRQGWLTTSMGGMMN